MGLDIPQGPSICTNFGTVANSDVIRGSYRANQGTVFPLSSDGASAGHRHQLTLVAAFLVRSPAIRNSGRNDDD